MLCSERWRAVAVASACLVAAVAELGSFRRRSSVGSTVGSTEASEEHLHLNGIRRTQHFPHHMPPIGRHMSPAAATYL